jgi:membrane protein
MKSAKGEFQKVQSNVESTVNEVKIPLTRNLGLFSFVKQVFKEAGDDHLGAFAGNLTYSGLFAMFPFFIFLVSLLGLAHAQSLVNTLLDKAATTLPNDAMTLIKGQILPIVEGKAAGAFTFGAIISILAALWGISGGFGAIMEAMNVMYEVKDARPFWKKYLVAILLSIAVVALLIAALVLVVFGPEIAQSIANHVPALGQVFVVAWTVIQWPVLLIFVLLAFALIYYFAPDVEQKFRFISPGAVVAVVAWLIFSLAFRFYVQNFGSYNKTYGTLAGLALLLVYMHWSSYFLLLGAEINQVIEKHAPGGKQPGEAAPGQPHPSNVEDQEKDKDAGKS